MAAGVECRHLIAPSPSLRSAGHSRDIPVIRNTAECRMVTSEALFGPTGQIHLGQECARAVVVFAALSAALRNRSILVGPSMQGVSCRAYSL